MSLHAHFITTCDGCGLEVKRDVPLDEKSAQGIMEEEGGSGWSHRSYARDMWSWAIPNGWLQVSEDIVTGRDYLFFHSGNCYEQWLRKQGRDREAEEFRTR